MQFHAFDVAIQFRAHGVVGPVNVLPTPRQNFAGVHHLDVIFTGQLLAFLTVFFINRPPLAAAFGEVGTAPSLLKGDLLVERPGW